MNDASQVRRKREASIEDLRRLLGRLSSDPAEAWQAYDTLRQKLILFFEYHCRSQAEEFADEVLDRMAKKSETYEITNVVEFAFGVARNLRKEAARKALAVPLADSADRVSSDENPEAAIVDKIDSEQKLQCFLKCLRRLNAVDRELLFHYYPIENDDLEEQRLRLAEKHQVNINALRTRMARLREKMEKCFENCRARRLARKAAVALPT
jgi:DNA-directed RNA polymerase specialized sigma24 family protein